jgi:8-oxo-dGTP diphosphatase
VLLVRHAWAGDRTAWAGDDRERPLDERGHRQAATLVERLAGYRVEQILTSPYRRCVETVAPLAAARGLVPEQSDELGETEQAIYGAALLRAVAARDVVVCGHGGLEAALVEPPKWRKGSTFVVDARLCVVDVLEP